MINFHDRLAHAFDVSERRGTGAWTSSFADPWSKVRWTGPPRGSCYSRWAPPPSWCS